MSKPGPIISNPLRLKPVPKKRANAIKFKDLLRQGKLFSDLYELYGMSSEFQEKFLSSKQSKNNPCLILKMPHTYKNAQEILDALKSFATVKET